MRILFILTALLSPACSTTWWSVEAGSMGLNSQEGVSIYYTIGGEFGGAEVEDDD